MKSFKESLHNLEKSFDAKAYLARFDYKEQGDEWVLACPECEKEKLWVHVEPKGKNPAGMWTCWYCDESGSPFTLVKLLEGLSLFKAIDTLKDYSKAVDRHDFRRSVERALADMDAPLPDTDTDTVCQMPDGFVSAYEGLPPYFGERGIDRRKALFHRLGYCTSGKYKNRLIVPVFRKGKMRWFLGRWMKKTPPEGVKKYLNSSGSKSSFDLYGIDAAKKLKKIVLVEDVFSKICHGPSLLATFGTHFSQAQLALLAETDVEEVVICWDPDAMDKAWKLGRSLSNLWRTSVAALPNGKDPDEMEGFSFWKAVERAEPCAGVSGLRGYARSRLWG